MQLRIFPLRIARPAGGTITLLLATTLGAASATAQTSPNSNLDEIVVIGSRAQPRTPAQSMSPVDVFSGEELAATGYTDLSRALQQQVPSLNFGAAVNAGGAANSRGPTLRGLGQDQVLVLVDGKRRHASALINFNNTIGRGQVPVDLNLIPLSAIERVEVLKDGAAAQYGSDAIAGIVNIVLKSDATERSAVAQAGVTEAGDGEQWTLLGHAGFALGAEGSLNISAQASDADSLNRAGIDSRFGRVTNQQGGDGRSDQALAINALFPVSGTWQAYGHATYARRDSHNTVQYRAPNISPVLFPNGFLPRVNLDLTDYGGTLGLRGEWSGWRIDLSDNAGRDEADFTATDTANTSLGSASPTRFDAGGARYTQNLVNLDVARNFDVLSGFNLAVGLEQRHESYRLLRGQPESFTGTGAQGFAGFNPPIPVDASRDAWSAYLDTELSLLPRLRLGAAVRYENYDDTEEETTGKIGLHWQATDAWTVRAVASTGFRAPSLQQSYFSSVTSQSVNGVTQTVGTFSVNDPVALALGGTPLRPETSKNTSLGIVWQPDSWLTFSADVYRIDIDDRIVLSETLSGPAVRAVLNAAGITSAQSVRFFTNAVDTSTEGVSVSAEGRRSFDNGSTLRVTLGYDRYDTEIERLRLNTVVPTLTLLGRSSIDLLAYAQPRDKINLNAQWSGRWLDCGLELIRFGEFRYVPVTNRQTFGAEIVANLHVDAHLGERFTLGAGVLNLTDNYADLIAERALTQGGSLLYPEAGGLGFEGRQYLLRFALSF